MVRSRTAFAGPTSVERLRQGAESERPVLLELKAATVLLGVRHADGSRHRAGRLRALPRGPSPRGRPFVSSSSSVLSLGPTIPMFAASGHLGGGSAVSGVVAALSVLAAGGGSAVPGVVAALSVLAAGGGSAVSGVGAALSALAAGGGVDRERDPRTARGLVALRGARLGFAAPALCVPAAEAFVLPRVVARARDVAALFSPLEPDAGVAAGSRRSISSATARSSETAARAARWACLPALSLTPLSAFAACLRRPTRRSRSKRSASFLAMILLLALPRLRGGKPYRGVEAPQRR